MSPRKSRVQALKQVDSLLKADHVILCEQVLRAYSQSRFSFINVIDTLLVNELPHTVCHFWMVAVFVNNSFASREDIDAQEIKHSVVLTTPKGKEVDLGTYPVDFKRPGNSYVYRLVIDFSDGIKLTQSGFYALQIYESSNMQAKPKAVLQTLFPVKERPPEAP